MSAGLTIQIDSNASRVLGQLGAFPGTMLSAVAKVHDLQNELTIGVAQRDKLSRRGPLTLGVVTNRLRSSAARAPARVLPNHAGVISAIGSNVVYAGAHDRGIDRNVTVRAHTRQLTKTQTTTVAAGRVTVRAHQMHMRFPARKIFSGPIEQRAPEYSKATSAAIVAAWEHPGGSPP